MRFDFHRPGYSRVLTWYLVSVIGFGLFYGRSAAQSASQEDRAAIAVEALSRLQGIDPEQNPKIKATILRVLDQTRGTANFVKLVQQFKLKDQDAGLLEVSIGNSSNETGVQAMRLLLE